MKFVNVLSMVFMAFTVSACVESKYEKMSNAELAKKNRHCDSIPKKSAVFANGCENIKKEIKRRKKR